MLRTALCALSLYLLFGASASAAPAGPLKAMRYFIGTWTCKGKVATPKGKAPYRATSKMSWILDGRWFQTDVKIKPSKAMPKAMKQRFWYGYDAKKKIYFGSAINNLGGYHHTTSKGWQGRKWIEDGVAKMGGRSMKMRVTFTKKNKRRFAVLVQVAGPKGWMTTNSSTCSR